MELNIENLITLAKSANWVKTGSRYGRVFYRTPNDKREWIDTRDYTVSVGAWFLWNNRPK